MAAEIPHAPAEPTSETQASPNGTKAAPAITAREIALVSEKLDLLVSNTALALTRADLPKYRAKPKEPKDDDTQTLEPGQERGFVSLTNATGNGTPWQGRLRLTLGQTKAPEFAFTDDRDRSGNAAPVRLQSRDYSGLRANLEIGLGDEDNYGVNYQLTIQNHGTIEQPFAVALQLGVDTSADEEASILTPQTNMAQGLCGLAQGDVERANESDVEDENVSSAGPAMWSGIDRQYFIAAVIPDRDIAGRCTVSGSPAGAAPGLIVTHELGSGSLGPGETWSGKAQLFLGPKRDASLVAVDPLLADAVDYDFIGIPLGFLARPMVFVLNIFYGMTASWGVAIMLLTLCVKSLLFPVTYKSMASMRRMQELRPKIEKLKARFEGDRERLQVEQMKLFKEEGVNPVGGCLPMLLQMPVWVALYRMLWSSVDLYNQSFLWLADLTAKEPFPFLALALGAITFLQQKITPTSVDSQQAKIMLIVMPIMLTFFMIALPSGLVLYILVNSVLTIGQQLFINNRQGAPASA